MNKLKEEAERIRQQSIEIDKKHHWLDYLGMALGGSISFVRDVLPWRYKIFAGPLLKKIIDTSTYSYRRKEQEAKAQEILLRKQRDESLENICDKESTIAYLIDCFLALENQLAINFPASNLTSADSSNK